MQAERQHKQETKQAEERYRQAEGQLGDINTRWEQAEMHLGVTDIWGRCQHKQTQGFISKRHASKWVGDIDM